MLKSLSLEAFVHLVVFFLVPAFAWLHVYFLDFFTTLALHNRRHVGGVRAEPVVQGETVIVLVLTDTDSDTLSGGVVVKNSQLALLMDGECGKVETLMVGPGFHNIAKMPLADMDGIVP